MWKAELVIYRAKQGRKICMQFMKQQTANFGGGLLCVTKRNLGKAERKESVLKPGSLSLRYRKVSWIMSRTSCWSFLRSILNKIMVWNVFQLCTIINARPIIISILSFQSENCLMSLWRRLQQEICFMTKTESMYALKKRYWMKPDSFGVAVKLSLRARYMSGTFLP